MRALRAREAQGFLTVAEAQELAALLTKADAAEVAQTAPSLAILQQQAQDTAQQNRALEALIERRERLAARLAALLDEARAEQRAIDSEVQRILQTSGAAPS